MIVYTSSEVQKRFSALLKKALSDGQVFVIRPETSAKKSPFDVRSIKLPITKADILDTIRESRTRYS